MNTSSKKNKSNPNIVLVIDSLLKGGAESQLVMLAVELHRRGKHCEVFALRAVGELLQTLEDQGVSVHNGGFSEGRDRVALLRGAWKLWNCIYKSRPCVVHTFLPLSNFIGSFIARSAGASVVITSRRGLGIHQETDSRWKYLDRISDLLSTIISVNSRAVGKDAIQRDNVSKKDIICIYNGIDLTRFSSTAIQRDFMRESLGLSSTEFAWVKVANLAEYKGHVDLLKAFAKIVNNYSARLFLVGRDLGAQQSIEDIVAKYCLEGKVVFLGNRNDVPQILAAMDGYVMASHSEGFSNAILEAMAAGLPIVATNVGGNAEALQNGDLGILVKSHDPEALGTAMQDVMQNKTLRKNLAEAAKVAAFEKYSVDAMVDSYSKLYTTARKS